MPRRRTVVLLSAAALFAVGVFATLAVVGVTQTGWGKERIRRYVEGTLNKRGTGKWHLGRLDGSLFTGLSVDTFAVREMNDSLFIATGRVQVKYSLRDLWDRRILVERAEVAHPVVHIRQDSVGKWNYRNIFPSGPPGPKRTTRGFGDYIVVRDASWDGGEFHLTMPWRPADSLRGARRDSAVRHALGRTDKVIRRVGGSGTQLVQTRSWTRGVARVPYARIADPDTAGRLFLLDRLDAAGFDPPISGRNGRGQVRIMGDSLWADFSHIDFPASRGHGGGKIWWGSSLPTRYDLTIEGDSVSLSDVAWVYPTLPTTGGGRLQLRIHNERDLKVLDYELRDMDVRTMGSRLRGNMTFGVGAPVLIVKDVDLRGEPVDWVLIERLTGEPLPYPWKGTIDAQVSATGGPVNAWKLERSSFSFADANVRGATARGRARGEIDMLFPALTRFRGLQVELDHLDLATIQFLNPAFPRLDGSIQGRAVLDSVWTDVRFRDADLTHRFGEEPVSRMTGAGRVTIGTSFLTYDVAMQAQPVELSTIAKAWPELALEQRGALAGPVRLQGTAEDLEVSTVMTGAQGTYAYDGRVDIDSIGGYGYHGTLRFSNANLRALYDTTAMPITALTGEALLDIVGDSVRNYQGSIALDLRRSSVDSTRIYDGARARLRFLDGRLAVDTLWVESPIATLGGRGGLGLRPEFTDSLRLRVTADSLGALRPYLRRRTTDSAQLARVEEDSLQGTVTGTVTLRGSIDTLSAAGVLDLREVRAMQGEARRGRVTLDLTHTTSDAMAGRVSVTGDTVLLGGVAFTTAALDADVRRADSLDIHTLAEMTNGPRLDARVSVAVAGDTTRVAIGRSRITMDDHDWSVTRPGGVGWWPGALRIDTISVSGSRGGRITLGGVAADGPGGGAHFSFQGDSLPLEDLAALGQSRLNLSGSLSVNAVLTGDRLNPDLTLRGRLDGTKVGDVTLAETLIEGEVHAQRFTGGLRVQRGDTTVLNVRANVPVDLALERRPSRLRDDTLRVGVLSQDVDLALVESFTPAVSAAHGRLNADLSIAGRRGSETLEGFVRVDSGGAFVTNLGVPVRDLFVDLRASRDTLLIERFAMVSGATPRNRLTLAGMVALDRRDDPAFDVRLDASEFHIIDKRRTGNLNVSAGLRFRGRESSSELTGSVTVDHGSLVIPELSSKEVVSLNDPDLASIVDTTLAANRAVLPRLPRLLQGLTVRNVQIAMGPDVRLRSSEANIKLGGSVNVIRATALSPTGIPQLAVNGALRTERGTFNIRFGDFLQRLFTIEDGEIRFYNDPDFNPTLGINALYTVRQRSQLYSNNTIRIRAKLGGTLAQPRLSFVSADSLQLSDSDLIAYLLTGRPSVDIGGLDRGYARDFLFTSLGASISARFSGQFFDYVQLQSAAGDARSTNLGTRDNLFDALYSTQIGVGKQINDRTFVNLTTGLCSLQQLTAAEGSGGGGNATTIGVANTIGGSLEYTIRSGLGVSVSREPPLAAVLCTREALGFAANRGPQWSLDLFKTWRW